MGSGFWVGLRVAGSLHSRLCPHGELDRSSPGPARKPRETLTIKETTEANLEFPFLHFFPERHSLRYLDVN